MYTHKVLKRIGIIITIMLININMLMYTIERFSAHSRQSLRTFDVHAQFTLYKVCDGIYKVYETLTTSRYKFAIGQFAITLLIIVNIFIQLLVGSSNAYIAIAISGCAYILCLSFISDKLLLMIDGNLFKVAYIESYYFPVYFISNLLAYSSSSSDSVSTFGNYLLFLFPPAFLIMAYFIDQKVLFGKKNYKILKYPFIAPSTFQITKIGLKNHIEFVEKAISKYYSQATYWHIEYFPTGCSAVISYPINFTMNMICPITIYISGLRNKSDSFTILVDSPYFEPKSSSIEINKDGLLYLFLNPTSRGNTKLTLHVTSREGDTRVINLPSYIKRNIDVEYCITIGTLLLYISQLIFD